MDTKALNEFSLPLMQPTGLEAGLPPRIAGPGVTVREAAKEFESYFLSYLLKVMRETVPKGLFENKAGQMFYSFYDQEIGRLSAEAGGLGLAASLERQFAGLGTEQPTDTTLKFGLNSADSLSGNVRPAQGKSINLSDGRPDRKGAAQ